MAHGTAGPVARIGGTGGPSISVVIPVRDDAAALRRCLEALARQTLTATEILVVDNGSTDGSAGVAAEYGARVLQVRVAGIPGATAAGLDAARGDVVARLDADSLPPTDWLEWIGAAFAADAALVAVSGAATFYGGPFVVRVLGRLSLTVGYFRLIAAVLGHAPLYGSNFAIRADLWGRMRDAPHRDLADVHDDLDISLQLPPGSVVRYDRGMSVAVSARSFLRPGGARAQITMAARTLMVTSRDTGLIRLRLAWFLALPPTGPIRWQRLSALEQRAGRRIWGHLARVAPRAGVDPSREVIAQLAEPSVLRSMRGRLSRLHRRGPGSRPG